MDPRRAMDQAWGTALEYFDNIKLAIDKAYPNASEGERLAAVVELCKVAAADLHSTTVSGGLSGTPVESALNGLASLPGIANALESHLND